MFLGSMLPTTVVAKGVSRKVRKDQNYNFDLNATLDSVYKTYKEYRALAVKVENLDEDIDELIILTHRGDIAGMDTKPYYNKKEALQNELDTFNYELSNAWTTIKMLKVIKAGLDTRIEDKLIEINKTEYKYSQYSEELDELLDQLTEVDTNYPAMIDELCQNIEDILIQLEYLTEIYECRSALDMNTTALLQQINELNAKYYLYSTVLQALLEEPEILESKIERILLKLVELETVLNVLYSELKEFEEQYGRVREGIDCLMTMIRGNTTLNNVLSKIEDKLGKLKKNLEKVYVKRGGSKKDKPEPLIESELVPLNLPGMTSTYAVIKILVTDELKTSDLREMGENCLLQHSIDGQTWYPLELDLVDKDGFYFGYLANKTGKYYFKVSMSNWYGNLGFDTEMVVYRGTEPKEKLDPDVSVVNVSFTYWYDGYTIQCANQQQLVPITTQNLIDDSNTRPNSLSSSLKGSIPKSAYQRSFVSYQDGDDIIAVGYAEINPNAPGPLRVVSGDSFLALETEINLRGNLLEHHFIAIPSDPGMAMVDLYSYLGINESMYKYPMDAYPGATSTYIESEIVLLNIESDEPIDCNYDISLRTNISYFVDSTNDDSSSSDSDGINETEADLEFNFTAENDTSAGSVLAGKLKGFSEKLKAKFKKWNPKTKIGKKINSAIGKFSGKFKNKWNNFSGKLGMIKGKFKDSISSKFNGILYKWLSKGKGLLSKFKGKYGKLFEKTNSTFKGLFSRLDFNVSKDTGEDVKNFCGDLKKYAKSAADIKIGSHMHKSGNFKNSNLYDKISGYKSKKKIQFCSEFNQTLKKTSKYTLIGDRLKKEMDRTITGTTEFSGIGIQQSKSQISGKWISKGRVIKDNETNNDTGNNVSRLRANNNNDSNNKEFNYVINQILLTIPETEQEDPTILHETIDLSIDIKPPEQNDIGSNSIMNIHDAPRIAVISYELDERPIVQQDDSGLNDIISLYDIISLDFELKDVTYEDPAWFSEDAVACSMIRSSEASSYVTSGLNTIPNINIDLSKLWSEIKGSYDINEEIDLLETFPTDDLVIYEGHGRYPGGPDFNVTQDILDNLTCVFTMDFDQINEFNEESENGSDGRSLYGKKLYEKGKSWVKTSMSKSKAWSKSYYSYGHAMVNKGKSYVKQLTEKGKDWAKNYSNKAKGYISKGKDWIKGVYDKGKSWAKGYIGKGRGFYEKGKEWANGYFDKGKSYVKGLVGNAKGFINKGQSWAKNKFEQGKSLVRNNSLLINDTRRSDTEGTDEVSSSISGSKLSNDLFRVDINESIIINDTNYKVNSYLSSKLKLDSEGHIFIARDYYEDGGDMEPYISAMDNNGSSKTYTYTHLLEYDNLGQVQSEDIFEQETGYTPDAWWERCNGWSSAAIMEPEPQAPIGERNNREYYKWSTTELARLDPEALGRLSRVINETYVTVVTGREIGYTQTVESSGSFDTSNMNHNNYGSSSKTTEFYQSANIQPGFFVPDLQKPSNRINNPDTKDKIINNTVGIQNSILDSALLNNVQIIEGNQVAGNSSNILGLSGELKLLEPINESNNGELNYVFIQRSIYEPDKPLFDPVQIGNINRQTGLIENPILKLNGLIAGELNEGFEIDIEGSITVKEDFTKQFGESVKTTLASGGKIGVKVQKNEFKFAELSGVHVTANINVGDKELELEGEISSGRYENDYSLDFTGSINVINDFSKQFGNSTKVTLEAGGKLSVKVNKSEFKYAELGPSCLMNISIDDQTLKLEGTVDGKIDEDYNVDMEGELKVERNFIYKKDKTTATLRSGGSVGAKVESSSFKSADLNLTCNYNITLPSINKSILRLNGAIDGKYNSGRIDFNSKLSTEDDFSYGRDKVIAKLRSGGVVKPEVESSKFKEATFGGIEVNIDVEVGGTDENDSLELKGAIDSEYLAGELKIATILGIELEPIKSSWADDPVDPWGSNTRVSIYDDWINGFIGGFDDDTPPSDDNNSDPNDNNSDPNNGNKTDPNNSNNSGRSFYSDVTSLSNNIDRYVDNNNSFKDYSQNNINESISKSNQIKVSIIDDDSLLLSLDLQSFYKTQLSQPHKWWMPKLPNRDTRWVGYSGYGSTIDVSGGDEYELDTQIDLSSRYLVEQFGLINDTLGTYASNNDTLYPRMTKGELISHINSKGDIIISKKQKTSDKDSYVPDDMNRSDLLEEINSTLGFNIIQKWVTPDNDTTSWSLTKGLISNLVSNHGNVESKSVWQINNSNSDGDDELYLITDEIRYPAGGLDNYWNFDDGDSKSYFGSNYFHGSDCIDLSQSYWTYWHWFDQITSGWMWDDEVSSSGYRFNDITRGYDQGKAKFSTKLGAHVGEGAGGEVEVEVDVKQIGEIGINAGKTSVDIDSDGKLEMSDQDGDGNATMNFMWKSLFKSEISAEDDWESPNTFIDSFFDISFGTQYLFPTGPAKLHWSSIVNFDAWDWKNNPDNLFPSGPAKGAYFNSRVNIELDSTGLVSGLGESPFIGGWNTNAVVAFILNPGGDVMGVEPSPFHFASSFSMQAITGKAEPGSSVPDRDYSSFFELESDTYGGNSGSGVFQTIEHHSTINTNMSKIRNSTGDDWELKTSSNFSTNIRIQGISSIPNFDPTNRSGGSESDENLSQRNRRASVSSVWSDFSFSTRASCTFHDTSTAVRDSNNSVPNPYLSYKSESLVEFGTGIGGRSNDSINPIPFSIWYNSLRYNAFFSNRLGYNRMFGNELSGNRLVGTNLTIKFVSHSKSVLYSSNSSEYTLFEDVGLTINKQCEFKQEHKKERDFSDSGFFSDFNIILEIDSKEDNSMIVRSYDKFHILTRGTNSRTWGDGYQNSTSIVSNSLIFNCLMFNGLMNNGLMFNGLISNGLMTNGLMVNQLITINETFKFFTDSRPGLFENASSEDNQTNEQNTGSNTSQNTNLASIIPYFSFSYHSSMNYFFQPTMVDYSSDGDNGSDDYNDWESVGTKIVLNMNTFTTSGTCDCSLKTEINISKAYFKKGSNDSGIKVMYNPEKVTIKKQVEWKEQRESKEKSRNDSISQYFGLNMESLFEFGSKDNSTMVVRAYDKLHVLTRGTNSRSWGGRDNGSDNKSSEYRFVSNTTFVVEGVPNHLSLMHTFSYSGIEMQKSDTTIAGDKYSTETLLLVNYGTFTLKTVSNFSSIQDILGGSGGNFNIDSFFDVYYDIPPERENITVRSSICQGLSIQGSSIQGRIIQGITIQGPSLQNSGNCTQQIYAFQFKGFVGTSTNSKETHPDFEWMGVTIKGYGESEDDLASDDNNSWQPRLFAVSLEVGATTGLQGSIYNRTKTMMKYQIEIRYILGENRSENENTNRIILSSWRDYDSNRSYDFGININSNYIYDDNNSITHSLISESSNIGISTSFKANLRINTGGEEEDDNSGYSYNFKLEILGVDLVKLTADDNLSIEQEVIDYSDQNEYLYYSYDFHIENLTPGQVPDYLFKTSYRYTGNYSYNGEITYYNETFNNEAGNGTNITIKVDTYMKTIDSSGNVIRELLFTDVIKIRYSLIEIETTNRLKVSREIIEVIIEHIEY